MQGAKTYLEGICLKTAAEIFSEPILLVSRLVSTTADNHSCSRSLESNYESQDDETYKCFPDKEKTHGCMRTIGRLYTEKPKNLSFKPETLFFREAAVLTTTQPHYDSPKVHEEALSVNRCCKDLINLSWSFCWFDKKNTQSREQNFFGTT